MAHPLRRYLVRLALLLPLIGLAALLAWQALSLFSASGQALAPVVGQYYAGEPWMATVTPLPTPSLTPTPFDTPTALPVASPTPLPTATPDPVAVTPEEPIPALPTPDAYLVEVALAHDIDPTGSYVIVNQNAQRMSIIQDGLLLRSLPVSSGDPDQGWYTPGWSGQIGAYWGTFSANGAWADDAWYLFQAGGSILIHSLPYTIAEDGSRSYQGRDELGLFPASRGCIRIAPEEARWFSQWGPEGVPIVVLPWDSGTGREG